MTKTPPGALPLPVVPGLTDLEVFARGGYATVYRATQLSVGREVAVKVENRTLDSERDQARFLREARAAGRMSSHPHVVDLFDVGVTPDQHPYLIMELCDGSYADRMRSAPLGPMETRDLGIRIADALAHAHAAGVLHRDVKPANILYSHFNPAVLADFGLAVLAEARDATVTLEVLTPAYAPPEMFSHHEPSPAVDVYALCATLYALMHGKPPRWQSDKNPSLVTVLEMFNQPIPDLPGVPVELVDVLRTGMVNDPTDRPTAAELGDLLASLPFTSEAPKPTVRRTGPAATAVPSTVDHPTVNHTPPTESPQPTEGGHPTVPNEARWWRWFFGGLGLVALAGAAGIGAWVGGHAAGPEPTPLPTYLASPAPYATGGVLPGCRAPLPAGGRCSTELQCFGPVRLSGDRASAEVVPCDGAHTFESYAEADLPPTLAAAGYPAIVADPGVREVCSPDTFRTTSQRDDVADWVFQVLPPEGKAGGTYRCLAGRGVNGLHGPTLAD